MEPKILIYHPDGEEYKAVLLKRMPSLQIRSAGHPQEALDFIGEVEILFSWNVPDDLLKKARNLRWFASLGAGNERLIRNPSLPRTVILTKPTVYGEMMAEYVFAYLLYFNRNLAKHLQDQKEKRWDRVRPTRLRGKVMGIVGLGSIGREIAKRAKQFGMDVLGVNRSTALVENVDQVFGPGDLGKMIPLLDYLVIALPLTEETERFIGEKELGLMREGAVLFNIGRGKTVDEKALIGVLKTGRIKAVLDVFEDEPLPLESDLWNLENVIVTPHVSGINIPEEICDEFVKNCKRWVKGEPLLGLVDRTRGY